MQSCQFYDVVRKARDEICSDPPRSVVWLEMKNGSLSSYRMCKDHTRLMLQRKIQLRLNKVKRITTTPIQ